jgi:hypothetical protein
MIKEDDVEAAVDYLRDTSKQYGQARGHVAYCENNLRRVKSLQMISRTGGVGEREAAAYASEEYQQAMEAHQNAVAEAETIRAYREAAVNKIEVWRSQNSAKKQGIV